MKRAGYFAVYIALRILVSIIQALSIETCAGIVRLLAYVLCDVVKFRAATIEENLSIALPESTPTQRHKIARRMWRHLMMMVVEVIYAPRKIHDSNWRKFAVVKDRRTIVTAMLLPRPKVLVTAHFGNFEVAGYLTGVFGFRAHTVARAINNPFIDAYVNRIRESRGQYILPKVGSAPQADGVLASGGLLVLLGDQHAGPKGCWVDFMGRASSCHKALALFTLINKAPMIAVYCKRTAKPMQFELGLAGLMDPQIPAPELEGVQQLTQWYNHVLEREIRQDMHQYWWVHRKWREEPPPKKRVIVKQPEDAAVKAAA
ncbi:MAG: lysophospholipid acyltransferase family protein [Pirellulaceae bacterium]